MGVREKGKPESIVANYQSGVEKMPPKEKKVTVKKGVNSTACFKRETYGAR